MGLLTDPKQRAKFSVLLQKHGTKLSILAYIAGVGYFLALAYNPLNARNYFSENALLPGLVDPEFHDDDTTVTWSKELKSIMKTDKANMRIPAAWLEEKFRSAGLEVYSQKFNFSYPMKLTGNKAHEGENVYAILRAPRSSSSESVVLTAPFRPLVSAMPGTQASLAFLLAFARHARGKTYWAKDLIFVVTEHEQVGMQAWLDAFHDTHTSPLVNGSELGGRSGPIQAAINLELPATRIQYFNLVLEGANGQLPNLDLVNTAVRLCRRERVPAAIHHRPDHWHPETQEGIEHSLRTLLHMVFRQASGHPDANHGLFHRYQIQALTLQGVKEKGVHGNVPLVSIGRVVEGMLRSLNNLLERFHQSFFFYLLPATERYISIGLYMPPFGLIAIPLVIKALMLWSDLMSGEDEAGEAGTSSREEEKDKGPADDAEPAPVPWLSVIPSVAGAGALGLVTWRAPDLAAESSGSFMLHAADGLPFVLLATHIGALFMPYIIRRKQGLVCPAKLLKLCVVLGEGVLYGCTALLNFSLALLLATATVPLTIALRPSKGWLRYLVQQALLLCISPLSLVTLACVASLALEGALDPATLVPETLSRLNSVLVQGAIFHQMSGEWAWSLMCLFVFPLWTLKLIILSGCKAE